MTYASTQHIIGTLSAVDWKGDAPTLPGEVVETHNIPGSDNVGFQLLGKQGEQFSAELTIHVGDNTKTVAELFADAYTILAGAEGLREDDPIEVVYCGVDIYGGLGIKYKVIMVKIVECKAHVRIVGDGYDYHPCIQLRIQFTMRPVYVGVPTP